MSQKQERSQPQSNAQQKQRQRQANRRKKKQQLEWSKRLTVYDNITFAVASIILIGVLFFKTEASEYAVKMLTTFGTVYVSVRLGYAAKSGVENYRKIANSMDPDRNRNNYYDNDYYGSDNYYDNEPYYNNGDGESDG